MTIDDRHTIDFVGFSRTDGTMILTISDHLPWSDYDRHSMALQDKITDYLEYVYAMRNTQKNIPDEHKEMMKDVPSIAQKVEIQLMMKYPPSPEGDSLLKRIEQELDRLGFTFRYQVFDPS